MELIASVQNPRIKQWAKLHTRKERERTGRFLLEGPHLVEEACRANMAMEAVLLEGGREIPDWLTKYCAIHPVSLIQVTRPVLEKVADTKTDRKSVV